MKLIIILSLTILSNITFAQKRDWQPAVSFSAMYSSLLSNSMQRSFTNNSIEKPSSGLGLYGLRIYMTHKEKFKIGIDTKYAVTSKENDPETYGGFYYTGTFAVYTGWNILDKGNLSFTPALLLGVGYEDIDIFGSPLSGKWQEDYGFAEPEVSLDYDLSEKVSIGLTTSYSIKFARTVKRLGSDLQIDSKDSYFRIGAGVTIKNFL